MRLLVISFAVLLFGSSWYYIDSKVPEYKNKKIEQQRLEAQIRLDQRRIAMQQKGVQYDIRTLNISPEGKNTGRLKGNMVIHCAYIKTNKVS